MARFDVVDNPWEKIDPDGRLRSILREQARIAETMRLSATSVAESIRVAHVLAEDMRRQLDWLSKVRIPSDVGRRLQAAWQAALAPNWRDLDDNEVLAAVNLMVDEGLNVAWAPRAEVVRLLLAAADTAERDAVLVARAGDVLDDVEANLEAVTSGDLADTVDAVREAVLNCREGRDRSCIALAAVVLSGVIHGPLGHRAFADARKRYEKLDPDQATLSRFRVHAVLRCLHPAIVRTDEWSGAGFNRHAAAHGLHAELYTQANAVAALLLVVGLLRELDLATAAEPESSEAA